MKKTILLILLFLVITANQYALDIDIGTFYGKRTVNDSEIRRVYGNGTVYFPYLTINLWKGIIIGGGYEGGYSKRGKIGLFGDSSSLSVTCTEFFIGYQFKTKWLSPYIKVGYDLFSYKQTIDSPYASGYKVDHKKGAASISGGIKLYPLRFFFLAGEIKYVPLKVKPFEENVDLGGLRYLIGAGFTFGF